MRRGLLIALVLGALPSTAVASPVLVLQRSGRAVLRNDRFLTGPARTPTPQPIQAVPARAPRRDRTLRGELTRLYRQHAITRTTYQADQASFTAALAAARRRGGTRGAELEAVIQNLHAIAAAGMLTPSRLPALFETLNRNLQWWRTGPLLNSGDRVEFAGSELVWEYYPGQGIELQELGSFGKADGLYTGGPPDYGRLRNLLAELVPLAADRGGGIAWEYYFSFDGGSPPWTSAMSQGTALEALTRAYKAFHDRSFLAIAQRALAIFTARPPVGVSVKTRLGLRYVQYSFAPGASIINAFLQTLIGLYDFAQASGDLAAAQLFALGNAEAQAEVPRFDTGSWSLYQPGQEDTLDYHVLVTGFLHELCARTHARVYCVTAQHFDSYLQNPPAHP